MPMGPGGGIKSEPTQLGKDLGIKNLPSADPTVGLLETERRKDVKNNPGPDTRLPPEVVKTKRALFERDHAGFFVLNFANEQFSTRCIKPNIRVLGYHKTLEAAQRAVCRFVSDPRVTSMPAIVPANYPFMIPYSEKTAMDEPHVKAKMNRNMERYNEYVKLRNEEFARRVANGEEGVVEMSEYHRRKLYLQHQKNREAERRDKAARERAAAAGEEVVVDAAAALLAPGPDAAPQVPMFGGAGARAGAGAGAGSGSMYGLDLGDDTVEVDLKELQALAREGAQDRSLASSNYTTIMARVKELEEKARATEADAAAVVAAEGEVESAELDDLPDVGEKAPKGKGAVALGAGARAKVTTAKRQRKAEAKRAKVNNKSMRQMLAGDATVIASAAAFQRAQSTLLKGDLPEHWRPTATTGTSAAAGARRAPTADEWPRDLESRHGKFVCMSVVDDLDAPSDAPKYPDAATNEPICVLFGGEFESADKAKEFIIKDISKWCTDLAIDVVDMYEWLWPTEVDPDQLEEEHRTSHAGFTQELNTVMKQRKKTMETTAEARAQSAALGVELHEINANADELPDASEVIKATKPGMWIQDGGVTQYDEDGNVIKTFEDALPTVGAGAGAGAGADGVSAGGEGPVHPSASGAAAPMGFRVDTGAVDFSRLFTRYKQRKAGKTGYEDDDEIMAAILNAGGDGEAGAEEAEDEAEDDADDDIPEA